MLKKFTIKIPNELYINNFSENKTIEFEYDGPEELIVQIWNDISVIGIVEEIPELYDTDTTYFITLNCSEHTEAAYWLLESKKDHVYEFEDVLNPDGSIYKKVLNPRFMDIYTIEYNKAKSSFDFNLIEKSIFSGVELKAIRERDNIISKFSNISLDGEYKTAYLTYINDVNTFLDMCHQYLPWKYIEFPISENQIPKIPLSLLLLLKQLGEF